MNKPKVLRLQCQSCGEPVILGGAFTVGCTGCDPGALDLRTTADILDLLNKNWDQPVASDSNDPVFPQMVKK
jgi:hypothetical protein